MLAERVLSGEGARLVVMCMIREVDEAYVGVRTDNCALDRRLGRVRATGRFENRLLGSAERFGLNRPFSLYDFSFRSVEFHFSHACLILVVKMYRMVRQMRGR